jgi:hypothetical protein
VPSVPVDGRPQYPMSAVWMANAAAGRWITAGVQQQVGDRYILDKWLAPTRASYGSPAGAVEGEPAAPKSTAAALALWPNLK